MLVSVLGSEASSVPLCERGRRPAQVRPLPMHSQQVGLSPLSGRTPRTSWLEVHTSQKGGAPSCGGDMAVSPRKQKAEQCSNKTERETPTHKASSGGLEGHVGSESEKDRNNKAMPTMSRSRPGRAGGQQAHVDSRSSTWTPPRSSGLSFSPGPPRPALSLGRPPWGPHTRGTNGHYHKDIIEVLLNMTPNCWSLS